MMNGAAEAKAASSARNIGKEQNVKWVEHWNKTRKPKPWLLWRKN